jgi:TonB family protein
VLKGAGLIRVDGVPVPDVTVTTTFSARPSHILHWSSIEGAALDQLRTATRLHLATGQFSYELPLADMPQLSRTLAACDVGLLESVGFSKEQQARVATPPTPPDDEIELGGAEYPKAALMRGSAGETSLVATIGPDGTVNACRILKTAGHPDLDRMACDIVRRHRYVPARDRSGRPMAVPNFTFVHWRISG